MLDENRVDEILSEICEHHVKKRNGGFNARCPVCGDSKKKQRLRRLHVDWYQKFETWAVTCYNGGCSFRSGNIYSLYATVMGISYSDACKYIDQNTYNTEEIKKRLSKRPVAPSATHKPNNQILDLELSDCLSVKSSTDDRVKNRYIDALRDFMATRHIHKPCFVSYRGRYKNRFIIPIFINKRMEYFQGRAMADVIEPKYLNPEVDKSSIIMNRDNFDMNKSIIVTEGIIDAWMVEDNQGTSVLGAHFNDDVIEQLLGMTNRNVVLCFDNPLVDKAGKEEIQKFMEESKFKDKVKYFLPDRKDFKDLNELRCKWEGNIYRYILNNSFSSLNVKVKLSLLYK